ncbi:MAG: 3-deoxy-manno-octulosonate cytidylyltransferase [Candidatus Cloacimonadota bacterium]|nr:MAG: 3-deoxy-manno-octulosonate cytidylyltransferase [Candidatus Cloacimonadota bacterium]PIE81120.1 MAG: 3-deoxy-manno-octulosonate cytidylyltransferase [Candidatus Delongbacteria bacterium]
MKIFGVIPSRYGSTRFPGKPLAKILGKPMIQWVYEACLKSKLLTKVIVATDHLDIYNCVKDFGGDVVMTPNNIKTGTDRCLEAVKNEECDFVVNIQGDEPLISASIIDSTIQKLINSRDGVCSTPITPIYDKNELLNENTVKVLFDKNDNALYFSRSPIPFLRNDTKESLYYKHIGLYVYNLKFLKQFVEMEQTKLEIVESLEQLRILENGYRIKVVITDYNPIGVDTPEDIEIVEKVLNG